MKANELRSGSIISINGKFVAVDHIRSHDFSTTINDGFTIIFNNGNLETDDNDSIEPIQLTPSILEAAGFVKYGESPFFSYRLKVNSSDELAWYSQDCELRYQTIGSGFTRNFNINYLHQLQNLYFAMTGTELEIDIERLK